MPRISRADSSIRSTIRTLFNSFSKSTLAAGCLFAILAVVSVNAFPVLNTGGAGLTAAGSFIESLFSGNDASGDDKPISVGVDTTSLSESVQYSQGFEVDGEWGAGGSSSAQTQVNRVASGTNGITSRSGGWHGEVVAGQFTRFGGYSSTFPAMGYTNSIDVFLDTNGAFANDTRFAYTSAISQPDGNHRRDFVFSCGYYNDAGPYGSGNRFVCSASNNAPGWARDPGRDPFVVAIAPGWYRFKHTFYDSGAGVLAVDMSVQNASGITLKTWTLSDATDIIGSTVGGNRYGWLQSSSFPFLAIDNTSRADFVPPTVVTVRPEAPLGWGLAPENTPGGSGSFVNGPGTPPSGIGSVRLEVPTSANGYILAREGFTGTRLDQITSLSYSTYRTTGGPALAPSFFFTVDNDVTDADDTFKGRLSYEPYHTETVNTGVWQTWNAYAATGNWWFSNGTLATTSGCTMGSPCSLAEVLAAFPNAGFRNTLGSAMGFKAGSGWAGGFDGNVDEFTIGIDNVETTYDFEPSQILYVDDDGQASLNNCGGTDTAFTNIGDAVAAANPSYTVRVCPGTYPAAPTVALNKAGMTIIAAEATRPVVQTSGTAYTFLVTAANVTIDNLEIQKTDVGVPSPAHNLIGIQASNFTAQNNLIYGPDPGSPWGGVGGNGIVSRAFEASAGQSGITIQNNTIHTLRQPGYMNASSGTISNNVVYGTRGWVIDSASAVWTMTGNSWGTVENEACDIALINSTVLANYNPLLALSANNTNAFICSTGIGGVDGRGISYVDNSGPLSGSSLDPHLTIQAGINGALPGGVVSVASGTYVEDILINKTVRVEGSGPGSTTISGAIGGDGATVRITGNNVEIHGFTITRQGNNTTDWNDPNLNFAGVAVQGLTVTNALIRDNIISGNRTGLDINNAGGHTIRNNVIDNNHTGLILRNQTDNITFTENFVTNNRTVGVLFLDASGGSNSPVQQALGSVFNNNNISGNWYGQIIDRQAGGSLPAPGTNQKNFAGNWLGSLAPVITNANSAEPGYAALIPVVFGGTATPPGGQPDIAGPASANFVYSPLLGSGTDTDVETTPGRGIFGFQGSFDSVVITPATTPTALDNDYTRINNAVQAAGNGDVISLLGTFDWTEVNAAASWAAGSDGIPGNGDDYSILAATNLNDVTITASSLGAATIQGPGDLPLVNLEGVFQFYAGGTNQDWTISNLEILDFDNPIGFYYVGGPTSVYSGTTIQNNRLRTARDLNVVDAPGDPNQNIAIHFSFGQNQTISGNLIEIQGDGVSNGSSFSTEVGMQSNTSGGNAYNGLQITNNVINVLNAQSANPQVVLGYWENAHGHLSNITVSGNQFNNLAVGNNSATNLQRGFRITSHSSGSTTVTYSGNSVNGANIGFQWLAGSNFSAQQPVVMTSNTIVGGGTGVLVDSQGSVNASFNRIAGNSVAGLNNLTAGPVIAENNWWGCNYGPGVNGVGCPSAANSVIGVADANPWLTLTTEASPDTIPFGGNSTITSALTINSNSVDTSGSGNVPNGTPATFAGILGTVAPPSSTTTNGVTGTVFTANGYGAGSASTTIDGQTVSDSITVEPVCVSVSIPSGITTLRNQQVVVPINVDDLTSRNVLGFDTTITYDPTVLQFIGIEQVGTKSANMTITVNTTTPGTLPMSAFSTLPPSGAGVLLNLRFLAIGPINSTPSPVNFTNFVFNEGLPCSITTGGSVVIISGEISGNINYVNAPVVTPVPNTTLNAAGSVNVSTSSNAMGNYTLSGLGSGAYTVTPSKTAQPIATANGISNVDSTRISQHLVGLITLNANQLAAADTTNNGTVSNLDASYIAQWSVGIANPGITGTWRFNPTSRNYANAETSLTNQNYDAILMGDVTGNWNPLLPPFLTSSDVPRELSEDAVVLAAPKVGAESGTDVVIPIGVSELAEKGVTGYQFDIAYDPQVLEPKQAAASVAGTLSEGMQVVSNSPEPGLLKVFVFGIESMAGSGRLIDLRFSVIGAVGTSSPIAIRQLMLNENEIETGAQSGSVVVNAAGERVIKGRLLTPTGAGVPNVRILLTDTDGNTSVALTSSFGNFEFGGVKHGATYTIRSSGSRVSFEPVTISVVDSVTTVEVILNQ